jgi:hypothetical protein
LFPIFNKKTPPALLPLVCLVLLLPQGGAAAQNAPDSFPSLTPDPLAAEFAGRGEAYSWEDLAEIALWSSMLGAEAPASRLPARGAGAPDSGTAAAYMHMLRQSVEELEGELLSAATAAAAQAAGPGQANAGPATGSKARGDYILSYMHRKFLRSYSALQTRLDTLLSSGRYNCVSSAVLYLILAQSQGLKAQGVVTRDHAFVTLLGGEETWDVETTNPYGFDPGNRREFHDQFGKLTGFAYVPARNYHDRTSLSPLELVSLIFHNRIAELERRSRYDQSVPLALNRAGLLAGRSSPTVSNFFTDPQRDLRDRLLNYGASLLNAGKEEEGLRWAAYAGPSYASAGGDGDSRWQEYIKLLASNRVAKLCRARRFAEAFVFLDSADSLLEPAGRRELETLITDAELTTLVNGIKQAADTVAILARIQDAESAGLLAAPRARELRDHVSLWRATDFHNRFAGAFNRRDYVLAQRILDEALAEFPSDRRLLNDRGILEKGRPSP